MSSSPTTSVNLSLSTPNQPVISPKGWGWLATFGTLFVLLHLEFFRRMWIIATTDNNWSHALVVPVISAYYLYLHRNRLSHMPRRLCWWGLPILFFGLLGYAWWVYPGRNDMFRGYCMIVSLFGLTLLLLGPAMMRIVWFPIAYLGFGVQISESIWSQIAWKLQQIAAHGATVVLQFMAAIMDFDIRQQGTQLRLTFTKMVDGVPQPVTEPLNVAEACSGLRMLMAFVALGAALAFLFDRTWWQRLVMIAMAVPIALAVNIGRVAVIGVLFQFDQEKATGSFHIFIGMLMLIPATLLFLGVGWALDHLFIDKDSDETADAPSTDARSERAQLQNAFSHNAQSEPDADRVPAGRDASGPAQPSHAGGGSDQANSSSSSGAGARVGSLWSRHRGNDEGAGYSLGAMPLDRTALARGIGYGAAISLLLGLIYLQLLNLPAASPVVPWLTGVVGVIGLILLVVALLGVIVLLRRAVPRQDQGRAVARRNFGLGLGAAVLGVSLLTQFGLLQTAGAVLVKQPVPLQKELILMPTENIGPWEVIDRRAPLPPAQEEELGTEKYITWLYLDTSKADPDEVDFSSGRFPPGSVARVHIAYYTGKPGMAPHVPDRCFVAGGAKGLSVSEVELNIGGPHYVKDRSGGYDVNLSDGRGSVHLPRSEFAATRFIYRRSERSETKSNVFYFFAANGQFLPSSNRVRLEGFDLTDKYSYFCKVEVQMLGVSDAGKAQRRSENLLHHLMPEVMACLPNWEAIKRGKDPGQAHRSGELAQQ